MASTAGPQEIPPKHFDISQLPSLKDGMTAEEEATKRKKTCRFIEEAGRVLKLPRVAIATAMVCFHRFYAKHSFNDHDRFEVAVACIVLAAKTEESPKKLNVVIDECHKLKQRGMQAGRGSSPNIMSSSLNPKGEEFVKLKERILLLERVILHTIGFELSIDHPYKFLVEQIKKLTHNRSVEYINPEKSASSSASQTMSKILNELVQYSMNFANDSIHTSLCLQFSPQLIAISCVYLAGHFAKVKPAKNKTWPEILGYPDVQALCSICAQIVDLVIDKKGSDIPAFQKIRRELEALKDQEEEAANGGGGGSGNKRKPPPPENSQGDSSKRARSD